MKLFGTTPAGQDVHAVTLRNDEIQATVLSLGAILQDVRIAGVEYSLTLGSDHMADYFDTMQFHGSVAGPVVNRLSNAQAPIDGKTHCFDANLADQHTLHSGRAGIHQKVWNIADSDAQSVTLSHHMPDGEGGFPGNRVITAWFEVGPGPVLRLTLRTTTDAPSLANATNHSYWNLDGIDHMRGHQLQVYADHYLPSDRNFIPTGEVDPVSGTPFDFNTLTQISPGNPPLDNTFCVSRSRGPLTDRMTLKGARGVILRVATTEPGVHLYDGRAAQRPDGPFHEGLAIECQGWPDAPNKPGFPSIEVHPNAPVIQVTQWRFDRG